MHRRRRQIVTTQDQPITENENKDDDWRPLMNMLISHGANVNALTRYSGRPLTLAISSNMWDTVEFLLDHGADPRRKDCRGGDAFSVPVQRANIAEGPTGALNEYMSNLTSSNPEPLRPTFYVDSQRECTKTH
jgi:hypothetical protein